MKTIRAFDENQNPVTVTLIGDRHLIVNGKEITNTADLSRDDQRQANNACDDLYDCPIFDGKRIITTSMPNCVTAYAWQLAERVETTCGEYFAEHDDENLSWCKPYITGKHAIIVNDGEVDYIAIDGVPQEVTPDAIRTLAKTVNDDYDSYQGWSDLHIALDAMKEVGCASCPCFAECEAMREIINQ